MKGYTDSDGIRWSDTGRYWARFKMTDYVQIHIQQHREVWEKAYGEIPEGYQIDHINHDGHDNRLENLRAVPAYVNNQNRKGANKNSKSGHRGVYWHKQRQKWHVQIMVQYKKRSLGLYDNLNDAIKAYQKEEFHA